MSFDIFAMSRSLDSDESFQRGHLEEETSLRQFEKSFQQNSILHCSSQETDCEDLFSPPVVEPLPPIQQALPFHEIPNFPPRAPYRNSMSVLANNIGLELSLTSTSADSYDSCNQLPSLFHTPIRPQLTRSRSDSSIDNNSQLLAPALPASQLFPFDTPWPFSHPPCYSSSLYNNAVQQAQNPQNLQQAQFKCRQLPCRTFISTGSCPYGERCVFLHDPGIVSRSVFIKCKVRTINPTVSHRAKRKSKEDASTDAFFWPTMPLNLVMNKLDHRGLPHISQPYAVPAPSAYAMMCGINDMAVYSMWETFLDVCKTDPMSVVTAPRYVPPSNPFCITNRHTGRRRLPIFIKLSQT